MLHNAVAVCQSSRTFMTQRVPVCLDVSSVHTQTAGGSATTKITLVCKRSSGWISYNKYIHITQPDAKELYLTATFHLLTANFIRHMVT